MTTQTQWFRDFSPKDLRSGILVFLIALPLCLGIAMASGFPPVAGILTAVVGGVIVSFLGSARLSIKGPAAGLIVIALGCVRELGEGDPVAGYHRALAVGVVAAALQILLSLLRAASVGIAMSPSVVHGMLAAIGVIIMSKQTHTMLGVVPDAKAPLQLILEIPTSIGRANPEILLLGLGSLLLLAVWPRLKFAWAKKVPAPVVVLGFAVPLGLWFDLDHSHNYRLFTHSYHIGPEFLVSLPGSLADAMAFPDFSQITSGASLKYIIMFTLVGSIESVLSVLAVDAIDPAKRASNLNRDLFATGVGNLIASALGGLPMISEIVRSKANIDAGATSKWSNFFHGASLLVFVAFAPSLLGEIPLAALAAMLVYTGARLASPNEFVHARKLGFDQLMFFSVTLVTTLATDLLVGVGAGLSLKLTVHLIRGVSPKFLFGSKVSAVQEGEQLSVQIEGEATFGTLLKLRRAFNEVSPEVRIVDVDFSRVTVIDHTFLSRLHSMANELPDAKLELRGLEHFEAASEHPHASRKRRVA